MLYRADSFNATHPAEGVGGRAPSPRRVHTDTRARARTPPSARTHTCARGRGAGTVSGLPARGRFHCSGRKRRLVSVKPLGRMPVTADLARPPLLTRLQLSLPFRTEVPGSRNPSGEASARRAAEPPSAARVVASALSARRAHRLVPRSGRSAADGAGAAAAAASALAARAQNLPGAWERPAPTAGSTRPPRPRPCSAPPAREGPRRWWQRRPACIRARGGSAPPCCTGTRPACAARPAPARAARRPRRRPAPGPRPPGSWRRPRARRGRAPAQVSARRFRAEDARAPGAGAE